jgi:hypothetical protein
MRTFRLGIGWLVLIAVLASLGLVVSRPYAVADWVRLRGYHAPASTLALADATTMTDRSRHLFFVNHAALEPKASFRDKCPKYDNKTIVVGCYQGGQRGIYILQVPDERLAGIEQVTAAHEVLHAAYERLSKAERVRVDAMLQDYASNKLTDERIKTALKAYETSEPGQQHNEMHSIFGTEIASLPPDLEAYYNQYFTSRATVAGFAGRYQGAFTSRQALIKQYDAQLQSQSAHIKTNTQNLEDQAAAIETRRQQLDAYRTSGNVAAYNDGVEPFNASVNAYNRLLVETRSLIVSYNALVVERNAIASQTVALQEAIDSSGLPQSQ